MTIATLKDFEIENIEEDYYTGSEFNGTWADNTCELCDVTIDINHNDKYYRLSIKPADPGAYGSYDGDWGRGKGISTEILIDIIQQLTDEPEQVTFENFINRYFNKYGFSHEVKLRSSKDKYYFGEPDKYYLAKPINLITETKTVKKLMPVYTYEQLTPESITQIVGENFVQARAYTFNEIFKELSSEKEYDQEKGLIHLIRLIAQDKDGRKNHDTIALALPNFDIEYIHDELDQYKHFVSVENKDLVYSLKNL